MKIWKIIALAIAGIILTSGNLTTATEINYKGEKNIENTQLKIEVLDIRYEDGKIIATIHSEVSYRTVSVYFYKSRIIGENTGSAIPIGSKFIGTEVGETEDISIPFYGIGNFLITVVIPDVHSYSEKIHVPIIKAFDQPFYETFLNILSNKLQFFGGINI